MTLNDEKNKELQEKFSQIEKSFNELIKKGKITIKEIKDLDLYISINENLREQVKVTMDENELLKKTYEELLNKTSNEYNILEKKFIDNSKILNETKSNLELIQEQFISGTVKLNNEISELNNKNDLIKKEKEDLENQIKNYIEQNNKFEQDFNFLKENMNKIREKNNIDIKLIQERFILLENMIELEKEDLINQNKELINKIKSYENN